MGQSISFKTPRHHQQIRKGLLFIPDISGFTQLVHSTDLLTGQQITYELLSAIMSENNLGLQIAEVEGDAILFYRFGTAPAIDKLLQQYAAMKKAFDKKRREIETRMGQSLNLSLKVIAHYGEMTALEIGGFKKLYGEAVIEAHRLMKNSILSDTYLLVTESLKEAGGCAGRDEAKAGGVPSSELCEVYGGLRVICFSYFDFADVSMHKQAA